MRPTFHLKTLAVAVAAFSAASIASAAGLDRSGQDVTAFFQDGTYAEAVYTYIDADVSGYDSANGNPLSNNYIRGDKTGDIAESYDFFRYGVKADINDTFSIGVLYDEPFGASAEYTQSNFVAGNDPDATVAGITGVPDVATAQQAAGDIQTALANPNLPEAQREELTAQLQGIGLGLGIANAEAATAGETTKVEVRSNSLTAILGMKLGPEKNFQIYGGPVAQRIEAQTRLRGTAYGPATGYTSNTSPDTDYGYIAGIAYSKPEIALKAALTYRSEIEHTSQTFESYPLAPTISGGALPNARSSNIETTTPKSINFDFQTGINPTTLVTAKARWVPWSDFKIVPSLYTDATKGRFPGGLALVNYDDDQYQVEVGVAKRLAPALAVSGTVGWDSGAGDPTTSLGPIEGYYSAGLGAKYNVTENWAVSAGGKYLWFGDAKGALPTGKIAADFQDNDGYIVGVKLSYQDK
ncbi:outer membrane protein transport protein [Psychrobacter sp. 1U2]|uniref:outer membrane protein transport protein n=1 Tax=Psychrobacter sp. 1U2 TaxID=3453577 RepID=UPI003F46BC91